MGSDSSLSIFLRWLVPGFVLFAPYGILSGLRGGAVPGDDGTAGFVTLMVGMGLFFWAVNSPPRAVRIFMAWLVAAGLGPLFLQEVGLGEVTWLGVVVSLLGLLAGLAWAREEPNR